MIYNSVQNLMFATKFSSIYHPRTTEYGYKSYRLRNGGTGTVDSR